MVSNETICELDLLAYADGRLDDDPARRAFVEAHLASDPHVAARVHRLQAQSEALRAAYAPRMAEPVPARLLETLHRSAARPTSIPLAQAAAVALMVCAAAAGGWVAGNWNAISGQQPSASWPAQLASMGDALDTPAPAAGGDGGAMLAATTSGEQADPQVPDLSALGFQIVAADQVAANGAPVTRVGYADDTGQAFRLFLQPVSAGEKDVRIEQHGEHILAYWRDGSAVSALASEMSSERLLLIAEQVRSVIDDREGLTVETLPLQTAPFDALPLESDRFREIPAAPFAEVEREEAMISPLSLPAVDDGMPLELGDGGALTR